MNKAISNIAWRKEESEQVFSLMKKYNFLGLEIAPTKIWENPITVADKELHLYKKSLNDQGIALVAMQSLLFGQPKLTIFEDSTTREKLIEYLKHIIHLAAVLGIPSIVFGSPKNRIKGDIPLDKVQAIAFDFFKKIGDIGAQNNVCICIEANPKEYGADFLMITREVYDFVYTLNHPNISLHLDTGAMALNHEDYGETIRSFQPFSHFHVSEPQLTIIPHSVDHKIIAQTLEEIHYNKWVSIEMRQHEEEPNILHIEKTLQFVSSIYQ